MQKVKFDGQEGVSQPDIDSEGSYRSRVEALSVALHITKGAQYIKYYQS